MRILAISDVARWECYESLLRRYKPDVVALAGDLVCDGWASFRSEAYELISEFKKQRKALMKRSGISGAGNVYSSARGFGSKTFDTRWARFRSQLEELESRFRDSKEFDQARQLLHVNKFYRFLEFAGRRALVLVVKGDHDMEFDGDYLVDRINSIPGCHEISGGLRNFSGVGFLGLGFNETHYRRQLRRHIAGYGGKADIVLTHAEQSSMPLVGEIRPKLIIRGHFGSGKYLVSGVPAVFTADVHHAIIDFDFGALPKIRQYTRTYGAKPLFKESRRGSCKPWFTAESEFERYSWLRPYPDQDDLKTLSQN
jgi:hypothetical protein